jgi:Tfp pilus tip-associated adhesin PilY1
MQESQLAAFDVRQEMIMNAIRKISQVLIFSSLVLSASPGFAADIDIYSRPPDAAPNVNLNPNILVVIDNSANWASASQHWEGGIKQGEAELNALRTVIGELGSTTNLGLMMFTEGSGSNPAGGYVRFHVRPMTAANKSALSELIGFPTGCTDGANWLNGTPNCILKNFNSSEKVGTAKVDYSAVMLEVFKYFGGYTYPDHAQDGTAGANVNSSQFGALRYAGAPDPKSDPYAFMRSDGTLPRDPYIDDKGTADLSDDVLVPGIPSDDVNRTTYVSPLKAANNCAKNYVIFIGNGFPTQDSPSTLLGPVSLLPTQGVGGDVTQLPLANLAETTSTHTSLLATAACGTYRGTPDSIISSTAACQVNAGGTFTVTAANPAVFTRTGHGLVAGDRIQLTTTGKLPNGLATLTTYYVIAAGLTANTFEVSLTSGGAAVGASGTQSGTHNYANFAISYPGYSSYVCEYNSMCTAGSTSYNESAVPSSDTNVSACGVYADATACQNAIKALYPSYSSHTCRNETACTATSINPDNPLANPSGCIAAANEADCKAIAASLFPGYSGFSCSGKTGTGCDKSFKWRIDATTKLTTGKKFSMFGITATTVSDASYSHDIRGTYTTLAATPDGTFSAPAASKINYFDEWAKFLQKTDVSSATGQQNVTTFTIDVFKDQQSMDQTSLLISAATAGGGKYFKATDETAIANALRKIFSEIQSVNSVFASSSLPVSVNTQGTYLNQVFMGMFRPEGSAAPRWPGNLKQYQFAVINSKLQLADKNGEPAISSTTGFITPCADSYWTSDTGTYWDFASAQALGDCTAQTSAYPAAGSSSVHSDAPDGEVVEKGGAAQRLRGVTLSGGVITTSTNYGVCGAATPLTAQCRKLLTCDGSSPTTCTAFTNFDTANTSVTAALTSDLIWWVRGKDVDNENANMNATPAPIYNEVRPSVHGGVVHSQPAVIDYGGSIGTIAFYGADDGFFHAVDGGQSDTEGIELWGFVPPESFGKFYRLRDNGVNTARIAFPGITGSPAPTPKDYFFDGSIGVFQRSGTVWIYSSMRRGGRAIYAFDVTDPYNPVIKWRKGCFTSDTTATGATICTAGWDNIGQTWSHPTVAYISGYESGGLPKPVLIFGGGYDECEDTDSATRCAVTSPARRKGSDIWFVDADTGAIIRTYPTHYSVPGDLAVLKDNAGFLTSVYAADTGGNVYRINIGSYDGSTFSFWTPPTAANDSLIAILSETYHARKFLNGPSVVPSPGYNAVLIGSGDREHPLKTSYACNNMATSPAGTFVSNQFYMLMDRPTAYPDPKIRASDLVDVTSGTTTSTTTSGITTITNVTGGVTRTSEVGWKFNFLKADGQPEPCEQTVNEGITIAGVTYFGTNTPGSGDTSTCVANLGTAKGYAIDFKTGNAIGDSGRFAYYIGGGMPPSPVAGVVDVGGVKYPFCIGCADMGGANISALQGSEVAINPTGSRYRSYWYIEND